MERLATRYPGYRWEKNAGYGTPDHLAGLSARGITPHHRRSFCAVSQLALHLGGEELVTPRVEIDLLVEDADAATDEGVITGSAALPPDLEAELRD